MKIIKKININFIVVLIITIVLFLIPQLFWGKLFIVGGDDSRLYYIFPQEFLNNFVFKITSDNILGTIAGYSPRSFLAPMIYLIFILKQISFLNVQLLMYGLNLGLGFLFFYLFLGIWIKNKKDYYTFIKIVSSFFYILSTYLINTFYVNQLLAVYLVFTIPCSLYFFLKSLEQKNVFLLLLSAVIFSLFSSTFNTLPWSVAIFIVLTPIFIYKFLEKKRIFISYVLIFSFVTILLNFHWILPLFYSYFNNTGSISALEYYSSEQFKTSSGTLIKGVSGIFSQFNTVFNERSTTIIKDFSALTFFKGIFILIIVSAGIFIKRTEISLKKYYLVSLSCLLFAFFFFSPSFGNWSINIFVFLNEKIPFFSMFRNMYDKFSFALAFSYAFAFAISATILAERLKNRKYVFLFLVIVLIVIFFNARSFIFQMHNDTKTFNSISGIFTKEFYDLTQYVKNTESGSRLAWIPLNYPSYAYMEDAKNNGHFYFGTSPLSILTEKVDYTGYLSFGTGLDPDLGGKIFKAIEDKNYSYVGKVFQKLNINYIIDNKEKLPNQAKDFLYSGNMLKIQDKNFNNAILGKEIKNFDDRFILYEINSKYKSNLFYLTDDKNSTYKDYRIVKFNQKSNLEYYVSLNRVKGKELLIFQDLYNRGWVLYLNNDRNNVLYQKQKNISLHDNFANGWIIDENEIKKQFNKEFYDENTDGSININLKLEFYPQKLVYIGGIVSLTTLLLIFLLDSYYFLKTLKR